MFIWTLGDVIGLGLACVFGVVAILYVAWYYICRVAAALKRMAMRGTESRGP